MKAKEFEARNNVFYYFTKDKWYNQLYHAIHNIS